jgi:hypothetical protein
VPCIFCIAVFALLVGAITTAVLDQLEAGLSSLAEGPVRRSVDSASVARFELSVPVRGRGAVSRARAVPVAVTVYKRHKRVRIQVLTHALTRAEAEAIEDLIAQALRLEIVDRSDAHDEQKVREAFGEDAAVEAAAVDADALDADAVEAEAVEAAEEEAPEAGPDDDDGARTDPATASPPPPARRP